LRTALDSSPSEVEGQPRRTDRLKPLRNAAAQTASALLARVRYPRFIRALSGLDAMTDADPDDDRISKQIDWGRHARR